MLTALRVENLAIVERVEVGFDPGLTVITGETGAGKSILVHALQLVLGGRASPDLVRSGADKAEVEALFEVGDDDAARARLRALDLPDDHEIVIRRTIAAGGRSRATVNGSLTTAAQLQALAGGLVDISSQHQHHTLADPATHLATLDAYAARPELLEAMTGAYRVAAEAADAVRALEGRMRDRGNREDFLRFQLAELQRLDPKPGEIAALAEEVGRLRHADRLRGVTSGAEEVLYGRERSIVGAVVRLAADLAGASALDPALRPLAERLGSVQVELEDLAGELGRYARRVDGDPETLARLEDRLHALERLAKRHGGQLDAAIAARVAAEAELAELSEGELRLEELGRAAKAAVAEAFRVAEGLSAVRREAADRLARAIAAELRDLGMGGAEIRVEVGPLEGGSGLPWEGRGRVNAQGIDRVELLIAPNPGEPPRPLGRIASGGELSRALLGTKRVLSGLGPVGTYVFDEVDTGVGGAVADAIGRKLAEVARHHQVVCITHQPQIAAFGTCHLQVSKEVAGGRTATRLRRLDGADRVEEMARMLGGRGVTDAARGAATALLQSAG